MEIKFSQLKVLKQLPKKLTEVISCDMSQRQSKEYSTLIEYYKKRKDQLMQEAAEKAVEKAEKALALAERINKEKMKKIGDPSGSSSATEAAAAASAKFNDIFDILESDLNKKKALAGERKAKESEDSSSNIIMELRKGANHPLLRRCLYTDDKLKQMARLIMKESSADTRFDYVVEDLAIMNDFQIHKICPLYRVNLYIDN
jgi:SNF2 family DNA or RNA helicase